MKITDIEKQLNAIQEQVATLRGWQIDSGALAVARCDTLVSLSERLREMILDHRAGPVIPRKLPPLGKDQKSFLRAMLERGPFGSGGWVWGSPAQSRRLLDSLINRGLVVRDDNARDYLLTHLGRKAAEESIKVDNGRLARN